MKQIFAFVFLFLLGTSVSLGQVTLAQWTFPTGNDADSMADGGIAANLNKAIRTDGGTGAIDFSKNGFTTKAAQATGWNDGADLKCWVVEITTTNYDQLEVSSKQQSGGNNPGPRDWKLQYRLAVSGIWTDVPDGVYEVQNDWTTGVLDAVELPAECKNQPSLFLRWVMTSNTNSAGNPVEASGIDKIDDIVIIGELINTAITEVENTLSLTVYPNPCSNRLTVASLEKISSIVVMDASGRVVMKSEPNGHNFSLDVTQLPVGFYLIRATTQNSILTTARFFRIDE
ncbi:MAG: T9SS type A sorting domain-containing protein [Bacteroidales bacterium]|nr:T9SS type A sorting domain-containing protein [Bacteroidales bacterium]